MVDPKALQVTLLVTGALDELRIPYVISGSMASIIHGMARATLDVDIVADIQPEQVTSFVTRLGDLFYADEQMMKRILEKGLSCECVTIEDCFEQIDR